MADFDLILTGSGITSAVWSDPASADTPSRLNVDPAHPPLYKRIVVPRTVTVSAIVGGVVAPPDSSLGGRLFEVHWVEWSGFGMPVLNFTPGSSSTVDVVLGTGHVGHFLLAFMRPGGGGMGIHFDGAAA